MTDELTARPIDGSVAGKTVLVTGSDGFIGSHVVERLLADGAGVRAFCLYNSNGSTGWLEESDTFRAAVRDGQAEVVLGDIRDPEHVLATTEGADEHINRLAKKYIDQDEYPYRQPGEERIKFVVTPERVRYVHQR